MHVVVLHRVGDLPHTAGRMTHAPGSHPRRRIHNLLETQRFGAQYAQALSVLKNKAVTQLQRNRSWQQKQNGSQWASYSLA
jgi:hypothetical protein